MLSLKLYNLKVISNQYMLTFACGCSYFQLWTSKMKGGYDPLHTWSLSWELVKFPWFFQFWPCFIFSSNRPICSSQLSAIPWKKWSKSINWKNKFWEIGSGGFKYSKMAHIHNIPGQVKLFWTPRNFSLVFKEFYLGSSSFLGKKWEGRMEIW